MKRALNSAVPTLLSAAAIANPQDIFGLVDTTQTFTLGGVAQALTSNVSTPLVLIVDFGGRRVLGCTAAAANAVPAPGWLGGVNNMAGGGVAVSEFHPSANTNGTYARSTPWTTTGRTTEIDHATPGVEGLDTIFDPIVPTMTLQAVINKLDSENVATFIAVDQVNAVVHVYNTPFNYADASLAVFKDAAHGGTNAAALMYEVPAGATGTVAALAFE